MKHGMQNTNFTLTEIYEGLKAYRGAIGTVVSEYGCTRQWLNLVLNSKGSDPALVQKAAEVWLRYAKASMEQQAEVNEIVNQARSLTAPVVA